MINDLAAEDDFFFVLTVQMLHGKLLIFTVVQDFLPKNMQPPTT